MTDREKFEAWISAPPYEKSVDLSENSFGELGKLYMPDDVQLAWEALQEARKE